MDANNLKLIKGIIAFLSLVLGGLLVLCIINFANPLLIGHPDICHTSIKNIDNISDTSYAFNIEIKLKHFSDTTIIYCSDYNYCLNIYNNTYIPCTIDDNHNVDIRNFNSSNKTISVLTILFIIIIIPLLVLFIKRMTNPRLIFGDHTSGQEVLFVCL
jgi:hypothetical protein